MVGNHLEVTRAEFSRMRSSGERIGSVGGAAPIESRQPRVVRFENDTSALLTDCYVDNTVRYDAADKPIGSTEPTFFGATATLVLANGAWKVASLQLEKNACRA